MIVVITQDRAAFQCCGTGKRYFGMGIFENHRAIVREVTSETGTVPDHSERRPGLKCGISQPGEPVGAIDVRKFEVHPVKTSEAALAGYPHGSLDGIDADIVRYARQVVDSTLLDLFETARVFE
jgi:hypothetical protein